MRGLLYVGAWALLLSGCLHANYYGSAEEWTYSEELTVSPTDVERVVLSSRQGPILFRGGQGDSIRVRLEVGDARGAGGVPRSCDLGGDGSKIDVRTEAGAVRLQESGALGGECVASWVIEAPDHLAVFATVHVGTIGVEGMRGGVRTKSDAGSVRVQVPSGRVSVQAGVGDIELSYDQNDFGAVTARTGVGGLEIAVFGREMSPGGSAGAGQSVELEGGSANAIDLRTNVGDVVVRLGSAEGARN